MNSVTPNAICPRCNGPASQTFSEVYCARDCRPEQTQPHSHVRTAYYSGNNTPRHNERPGWPDYVPNSTVSPQSCEHYVVYRRQQRSSVTDTYFCYDCGLEVPKPDVAI